MEPENINYAIISRCHSTHVDMANLYPPVLTCDNIHPLLLHFGSVGRVVCGGCGSGGGCGGSGGGGTARDLVGYDIIHPVVDLIEIISCAPD